MKLSTDPPARTTARLLPLSPRARRRRIYGVASLCLIAGLGGALLVRPPPDCRTVSRTSSAAAAVAVCEREYLHTQDPATGALLAEAELGAGDRLAASALANGLLATPARGDALRLLGQIALSEHRLEAAVLALEHARYLHRAEGRREALARDDELIAEARRARSQRAPGLPAIDP